MLAQRQVPFFDYPDVFVSEEEAILKIVADVGRRGAFILQRDLEEFEQRLAEYIGAKHVVGLGNATDALYLLCRAAGLGPGDEVIFCSHTMVATASGIHFSGATPIPVEVGPDRGIDPDAIEPAITPRTKAVLPTQLNGRCADMDRIRDICDRHGLMLLEDSAQALGAKFGGQCAGTFGRGGVISFYPAKTLGCLGDGGCIVTNDDEVYRHVIRYRDHGRDADLDVDTWALNSRLDNLQAAILNHKLTKYDQYVARRREVAARYDARLRDISQLDLPPAPDTDPRYFDIYQNYEVLADQRDRLRDYLREHGIGTIVQWGGKPVHAFRKLGFTQSLPVTEEAFTRLLLLPMNTSLTDEDVDYVCATIAEFYRQ